jgi:hypothetical protein
VLGLPVKSGMASSRDFRAALSGWSFCATGRHPWFRQRATCMCETDNPAWRSLVATRRVLGFAMLSQIFRALVSLFCVSFSGAHGWNSD